MTFVEFKSLPPLPRLLTSSLSMICCFLPPSNCEHLMEVISEFCTQSINSNKSIVMLSRRSKPARREAVLQVLGLPEGREMGRYLGLPLITDRLRPEHFTDLQERSYWWLAKSSTRANFACQLPSLPNVVSCSGALCCSDIHP